ncbi:hypothetical protein IW262DRAFT_1466917 [Armillaria fumosa]|nr:hypothetical protein IW262DRAFT_1466917 [Armillaria fumosa]
MGSVTSEEVLLIIVAILIPPIAVIIMKRSIAEILINVVLTLFFWIGGIIHALTTKTTWFDGGLAAVYIDWDMERKSEEPLEAESWDYKNDAGFWRRLRHRIADEMHKYDPPGVTLSAFAETGLDESTIPVLNQRTYTGRKVIPSALADTSCADLGVHGVFEKLNTILGTSYVLSPTISSVLESYVRQNWDFGTVYAHLRFYWFRLDTVEKLLRRDEENDREMRKNAIVGDRITRRDMVPRRIWDLYANRVVPYWVALVEDWVAISHSWVNMKERLDVMTPINGYEWPVPIPNDADLNLIRIEMLNFGAEYAWLDVLCLRQEHVIREDLRKEEWKLDVPTIGYAYDAHIGMRAQVVCYLSGLGRPMNFKQGVFEGDRSWFNRAWTLQEVPGGSEPLIAGDTGDDRFMEEEMQTRVHRQLQLLSEMRLSRVTFNMLLQMQSRMSTKPLDKVAALVYPFSTGSIPIYDAAQSEEDAWTVLVDAMPSPSRADLFFYYPGPGNKNKSWRPSWKQAMAHTIPWCDGSANIGSVRRTEEMDSDWYEGPRFELIYVKGLAETLSNPRQGTLLIKDGTRGSCECKIVVGHTYPIPDGWYTLIGTGMNFIGSGDIWVVGRLRQDGKFEKVSVIHLANWEEMRKAWELIDEKCVKTVLC